LYGVNESAPSALLSGTETTFVSLLLDNPLMKDCALSSVRSAVEVHTCAGFFSPGYLRLISTPRFIASLSPIFVRSSSSSSEMGVCHVARKASGPALLQSTVVFFNSSVNGSMYSS
jgi:hypothetical protein